VRAVQTYVIRVWLPDRPGALGQVASRIGAVRGDVVGIEILERGAGRAVDELLVTLADDDLVDLLVAEIGQVDGVDVEDVRPLRVGRHDPGIAALDLAAALVEAEADELLPRFCADLVREFDCDWATAVDLESLDVKASVGESLSAAYLAAFIEGFSHLGEGQDDEAHPEDLVWARLPGSTLAVAAGRDGRPFRWRERRQIALLARIAGSAAAVAPGHQATIP
jgi:hypothetical protein